METQNVYSYRHRAPYIVKKIKKVIEKTNCILDTLWVEYAQPGITWLPN